MDYFNFKYVLVGHIARGGQVDENNILPSVELKVNKKKKFI